MENLASKSDIELKRRIAEIDKRISQTYELFADPSGIIEQLQWMKEEVLEEIETRRVREQYAKTPPKNLSTDENS